MYCSQCGSKVVTNANFCSNCGQKISYQPNLNSSSNTGEVARKIKKEISSLPFITLIGDAVQGASGLSGLQEGLKKEPYEPLNWLFYYECYKTYTKIRRGVSTARVFYNPVGFIVSKGVSVGLNAMDDEFEEFDSTKCLKAAISLARKRIGDKKSKTSDFLIAGKALFYLAQKEKIDGTKNKLLLDSIKYISYSIECETDLIQIGEYFNYLALVYDHVGNKEMSLRSLNLSVKYGFQPSLEMLRVELRSKGITEEQINKINIDPSKATNKFRYTYSMDAGNRIGNTLDYVFESQGKKIKEASMRIKAFLK